MVIRAQQVIVGLKTPLIGAVLTQVPKGSGEDYGYYTQAYSYYSSEHKNDAGRGGRKRGPDQAGPGSESINLK
jgi:hypothetical protein